VCPSCAVHEKPSDTTSNNPHASRTLWDLGLSRAHEHARLQCCGRGTRVHIPGSHKRTSSLALEEHVKGDAPCPVAGGSHAPGGGKQKEAGQRCFQLRHLLCTQCLLAFLPAKQMEPTYLWMEPLRCMWEASKAFSKQFWRCKPASMPANSLFWTGA